MLKNILELLKIIGLILLAIFTFGLVNKLTSNKDEEYEKLEEEMDINNKLIEDIDRENEKIEDKAESIRDEIQRTNESIEKIKEKRNNIVMNESDVTVKEAADYLRNIGK